MSYFGSFDIKLRPNIANLKISPTLKMAGSQRGSSLLWHAGFGESAFPIPRCFEKAIQKESTLKYYACPQGDVDLRQSIASYYRSEFGLSVDANDILIFPGSKQAFFSLGALLDQTCYLLPQASWVSYEPQACIHGHECLWIPTRPEDNYALKANILEDVLKNISREGQTNPPILFLNNPTNPTGYFYSKSEITEIAQVARRYRALILYDSIYATPKSFLGRDFSFPSEVYPEGTFITSGMSKVFSAGGKRLGFLILPPQMKRIKNALVSYISETFSAVCITTQKASVSLFGEENRTEIKSYIENTQKINAYIGHYLYQSFSKMELCISEPEGAFYLMPSFSNYKQVLNKIGIMTSSDLTSYLYDKLKISFLPGSSFGLPANILAVRVATQDFYGVESLEAISHGIKLDDDFIHKYAPNLVSGISSLKEFLALVQK